VERKERKTGKVCVALVKRSIVDVKLGGVLAFSPLSLLLFSSFTNPS